MLQKPRQSPDQKPVAVSVLLCLCRLQTDQKNRFHTFSLKIELLLAYSHTFVVTARFTPSCQLLALRQLWWNLVDTLIDLILVFSISSSRQSLYSCRRVWNNISNSLPHVVSGVWLCNSLEPWNLFFISHFWDMFYLAITIFKHVSMKDPKC